MKTIYAECTYMVPHRIIVCCSIAGLMRFTGPAHIQANIGVYTQKAGPRRDISAS